MTPKRRRPRTELQLYRQRIRDEALERREKMSARAEAKQERRLEVRERALAEARQAFAAEARRDEPFRLEMHDPERSGMWSGLAVGLGVAALVGVAGVVVYLLVRKQDGQVVGVQTLQGLQMGLGRAEPPIIVSAGGGMPESVGGALQAIAQRFGQPRGQWGSAIMKSYRLPSMNDRTRGAIRVAQATDVPYEVVLRTVEPAGQYAVFAYNANELNTSTTGTPVGDSIIIPAGQWQHLSLKPREVLYAKGSNAAVIISVTMNEYAGGAY